MNGPDGADRLCSLIYISTARKNISAEDIANILQESRSYNLANDITGLLMFGEFSFIQVIEGYAEAVDLVFSRICRDDRHSKILKCSHVPIDVRQFADWTMAFHRAEDLSERDRVRFAANLSRWRLSPLTVPNAVMATVAAETARESL